MNETSLNLSLRHLAWSNQKFFAFFGDMTEEVFGWRAADGEWPVGRLLTHLVGSGEWYRYCLEGTQWTDLKPIRSSAIALEYLPVLAQLDDVLVRNSKLPDENLEIQEDEKTIHATRSLILSQAIMHAAEHKGQIATILKMNGVHIDLDSLDVWHFMSAEKYS
jgi:uncharacterized damage-inducible protein DinB